jgi:3-oxoacyl-[acyl-carrier-protein] synthase-3
VSNGHDDDRTREDGDRSMTPVYLSSIGYVHGEPRATEGLLDQAPEAVVALLAEVPTYRASDREIWRLAVDAAQQSLCAAHQRPQLLVYVSENEPDATGAVARFVDTLGLNDVEYLTMAGHDCGNFVPALRIAHDAVVAGRCDTVLLVLADSVPARNRLMLNGMSVLSDGASACVVSNTVTTTPGAQFRVSGLAGRTSVRLNAAAGTDQTILTTVQLAGDSVRDLLELSKRTRDDYRHVVFGNYRMTSQRFLTTALRFPPDRLLTGAVAELGHCFSADVLVTLAQRYDDGVVTAGDRVLASATGPHSWSVACLECL